MTEDVLLKPYKGITLIKSWEVDGYGKAKKDTVVYSFCDDDGNIVDCSATLDGIKKMVDEYLK